jgi:hypothetical protein
MLELGSTSCAEMVLCFLRAEIDSDRNPDYLNAIHACRLDRASLVDKPDLADSHANCTRETILGAVRGYGRNDYLFHGFPQDTTWRRASLDPSEFGRLKYINCAPWFELTKGTRSVQDGVANLNNDPKLAGSVADVSRKLRHGVPMEDLILIENLDNRLVILEGRHPL